MEVLSLEMEELLESIVFVRTQLTHYLELVLLVLRASRGRLGAA